MCMKFVAFAGFEGFRFHCVEDEWTETIQLFREKEMR